MTSTESLSLAPTHPCTIISPYRNMTISPNTTMQGSTLYRRDLLFPNNRKYIGTCIGCRPKWVEKYWHIVYRQKSNIVHPYEEKCFFNLCTKLRFLIYFLTERILLIYIIDVCFRWIKYSYYFRSSDWINTTKNSLILGLKKNWIFLTASMMWP